MLRLGHVRFYSEATRIATLTAETAIRTSKLTSETKIESDHAPRHTPKYLMGSTEPTISRLPPAVSAALSQVLRGYPRSYLRPDVDRLLELYKEQCAHKAEWYMLPSERQATDFDPDTIPKSMIEYGERETHAYLAWQMPFAYGTIERVFAEIKKRIPSFNPQTICDFGSGPGTAIWALNQMWPVEPNKRQLSIIDLRVSMLEMNRRMMDLTGMHKEMASVDYYRTLSIYGNNAKYDLSVAAFSLSDLPDDGVRKNTIDALWRQCKDILVLVERGTPEGSRIIANARKQILQKEGYLNAEGETLPEKHRKSALHIVAPCSQEGKCPMSDSWCHFAQRVEVTRFQQEVHKLGKGFEDQKFSYLVIRKGPRPQLVPKVASLEDRSFYWPRIIRRPLKRSGHIINDICDKDGTFKRVIVPKSQGKRVYYDARKCSWGDLWPHKAKNAPRILTSMKIKRSNQSKSSSPKAKKPPSNE